MRKTVFALLMLFALFAGTLVNIRVNDKMVYELEAEVHSAVENGDVSKLDTAVEHWLSLDGYTHIFIRHAEIDAVTDAFFALQTAMENGDDTDGAYGCLMAHLESIRTMEHISLGSVF